MGVEVGWVAGPRKTKGCLKSYSVKCSTCILTASEPMPRPERFEQRCAETLRRLFTAPVFSQHNENGARRVILKLGGQDGKTGRQLITCCNVIKGAASDAA